MVEERRKQKIMETKIRQVASAAEQIRILSERKVNSSNRKALEWKNQTEDASRRINQLERELLLVTAKTDRLEMLENQISNLQLESKKAKAELELEREKRKIAENKMNLPERDLEAQFRSRTQEIEQELRDKNSECENLEWRLRNRSDKLNSLQLQLDDTQKENIRLTKEGYN